MYMTPTARTYRSSPPVLRTKQASKRKYKYTVTSLFAGCGGLDLGFVGGFECFGKRYSKNDFELTWSNDSDKNACLTYQKNLNKRIVCGDITKILQDQATGTSLTEPIPKRTDVVLGGFPCQDFSVSGKRRGLRSARGNLYKSMVEVVKRTKPLIFLAENVRGLLSMDQGSVIEKIKKDFTDQGYQVTYELFNVTDFGVPENRERVVIVGTRIDSGLPMFTFPEPEKMNISQLTTEQAIGDLEDVKEGDEPNHFWSKAKHFPGTQGNKAIEKHGIAPTMRAEHHGNIEYHWNKKRRLSAREVARIQTFPDNFIFYPSTSSAYKQIGNAVPPVFAWYLARGINKFLDKNLV